MNKNKTCAECGEAFTPNRREQMLCGIRCRNRRAGRATTRESRPCATCGTMIRPRDDQNRYCSIRCRAEDQRTPKEPCPQCKIMFRPRWGQINCSKRCANAAQRTRTEIACPECGEMFLPSSGQTYCGRSCAAKANGRKRRKPGGLKTSHGYVLLRRPDHPMATRAGYVMEHRLVMAREIGRPLRANEVVHHTNGVKEDNRPENLELMTESEHNSLPKPPASKKECPHCGGMLALSNRVRRVEAI